MTLVEWFRDLAPDQAFLFSLPFLVAVVALMSDWLRQRTVDAARRRIRRQRPQGGDRSERLSFRSTIRGSNVGQRGKCPIAVVAAGRSRRSASALPSAANVRSIGNLKASSRSAAGVVSS